MTTALMPLDPAATPQHANRVLGIRANLLPTEITAGRTARRVRFGIAGTAVLAVLLTGGWYGLTLHDKSVADSENAAISKQVTDARAQRDSYSPVTVVKTKNEELKNNLKTVLAGDLRWSAVFASIRSIGTPMNDDLTGVSGQLVDKNTQPADAVPSTSQAESVLTLNISGTAPDKKTVARYIDRLAAEPMIANAYISTASEFNTRLTFTMTASVTAEALCGRWSATPCTIGGK